MNLIPVSSNEKTIPMTVSLKTDVHHVFRDAWKLFLRGELTELTDENVPSELTAISGSAFRNCSSLETVSLSNIKTIGTYCFYDCRIENFSMPKLENAENYSLAYNSFTAVTLPNLINAKNGAFWYCSELETADFEKLVSIYSQAFYQCSKLENLILRSTTMVSLSSINALSNTKIASGEGFIYVPESLITTYQSDVIWNTYSERFRAVETLAD